MENSNNLEGLDITRKHDITIEEVREMPIFAHFTDEQAQEVVRTVKEFVNIAMYCYFKENPLEDTQE